MKTIVAMSRTCLLLTVLTALGVGGAILAQHVQHTGKGQVKVTQLSQRHIIEKLDGKESSATVVEVTFEPRQELERAAEAYDRMMSGKARFRVVLTM
jgi:D-arabinose 1-dehydrogenase-like Zn-dependent alcohol dehydrogenase